METFTEEKQIEKTKQPTDKEFLEKFWNYLIAKIDKSKLRYNGKKAIKVLDFYISKHKMDTGEFCLSAYIEGTEYVWSRVRGAKVFMLKNEFMKYMSEGYDRVEDIRLLKEEYDRIRLDMQKSTTEETKMELNQELYNTIKELNRIKNEKHIYHALKEINAEEILAYNI